MSDIFICYSRADAEVANRLAAVLRAQGWSVFLDTHTLVGRRWHKAIEKELHAARSAVALWSASSRESDFVLEEAEYAKRKDVLFPAFIERVEIPYGFGRIQTADLIDWTGAAAHTGLEQLLAALRLHLGVADVDAAPPPDTRPPRQARTLAPGQTFRDKLAGGGEGPPMVVIPAGRFLMGSPPDEPERSEDEGPQREVRIAQAFSMGVYAVTFDDYDRYVQSATCRSPDDAGWGRNDRPVIDVSWDDARSYCVWLSEQSGRPYRLPSEAEWEYACRAGTTTPFHFGARITTDQANFNGTYVYNGSAKSEYREKTTPVGSFPSNAFGLYDMHGNVWEWCRDTWHENYAKGAPADGAAWEDTGESRRVLRGGSWGNNPGNSRAASRGEDHPDSSDEYVGFRVCCGIPIE